MSCRNQTAIQKFIVYHLVFFFILTPFLASCSGSGSSSDSDTPTALTEEEIVANAVEDQNRSAMSAIDQTFEMLTALDNAKDLIENTFGTLNPTDAEIEAYAQNNSEDAEDSFKQLDTELEKVRQAADSLVESVEEMEEMEDTISNSLYGAEGSTSQWQSRKMLLVVSEFLIAAGILGAFMGFGLAVAEKSRASDYNSTWGENLKNIIRDTGESIEEGGKAAATSVATTIGSLVSGTLGYKKVKLVSDTVGVIDNINTANKGAIALRHCQNNDSSDSEDSSPSFRKNMEVDYESLEAGDIYIGTPDENGTFHNVPPGEWTFIVFVDGYLRTVTECINAEVEETDTIEVEITPVSIEEIGDLLEDASEEISENQDEGTTCNNRSDCEEGYFCYLGFCKQESEWLGGNSRFVGYWHVMKEYPDAFTYMMDVEVFSTGHLVYQPYAGLTELTDSSTGSWRYDSSNGVFEVILDDGDVVISGQPRWEEENDFWVAGDWFLRNYPGDYAWIRQDVQEETE